MTFTTSYRNNQMDFDIRLHLSYTPDDDLSSIVQWTISLSKYKSNFNHAFTILKMSGHVYFKVNKACGIRVIYAMTFKNVTNLQLQVEPVATSLSIRTNRKVPKLGVMLVGWGGNNGSTITAALEANRRKLEWRTRTGTQQANWYFSKWIIWNSWFSYLWIIQVWFYNSSRHRIARIRWKWKRCICANEWLSSDGSSWWYRLEILHNTLMI